MMSYPGKLIFIMGVSGSGKKTIIDSLMKSDLGLIQVNSYTTRPLRTGEVNGEDYYHITQEEFDTMRDQGDFLEISFIHKGFRYGTKKVDIIEKLEAGDHIVKEIDIHGFISMHEQHKDVLEVTKSIFLNIDDETMIQRITKRSSIDQNELQRRLQSAIEERVLAKQYCSEVIDGSGSIEEVATHAYALISGYIGKDII